MKNRYASLILLFVLSVQIHLFAQHTNFNSQRNWSLNKKELQFGLGATQFNGDLGGSYSIGQDYSTKDIDWPSTGFAGWLGYRQRFHPYFATTTSLCLFNLKGDDKYSEEATRNARNLHFRSFNIEIQQRLEFIFFARELFGSRYNLPGAKSKKNRNEQYYLFGGLGLCYFNPQAQFKDGSWMNLRPLKTEGQSQAYSPLTLTIPFGFGFRVGVGRSYRIGIEIAYVKTFSDYMDDVSTVYADPNSFPSDAAAYFSNPAIGDPMFAPGNQRGDSKHKDAYYHLNLIVTKNLTFRDYGRQRSRNGSVKPRGRYKV
ncbi:MAG: hypothetical protein RLZ10_2433 [Bacteroidota bacterium]|jgi:hypothetical protein